MVDGSHLPFEENILYTKYIANLAHQKDICVEAELGRLSGTEDDLTVEAYEASLTDINEVGFLQYNSTPVFFCNLLKLSLCDVQAEEFIDGTGIDALAVCIGNVHGKYPANGPKLKLDLLKVRAFQSIHIYLCDEEASCREGEPEMQKILRK